MSAAHEIGRELLFSDLKPRTIVVIAPPDPQDRGICFTMWCQAVTADLAVFVSGVTSTGVISFRGPDDTLTDDQGRKVTVFEYLGEP